MVPPGVLWRWYRGDESLVLIGINPVQQRDLVPNNINGCDAINGHEDGGSSR